MITKIIELVIAHIKCLPECKEDMTDSLELLFDFISDNSYTNDVSVDVFMFGRFLTKVGDAIQNSTQDSVEEYLTDREENIDYEGSTIYLRNNYKDIYPKDEMLTRYQDLYDEQKEKSKAFKDAVKNRKQALKDEGKVLRDVTSKSVIVKG